MGTGEHDGHCGVVGGGELDALEVAPRSRRERAEEVSLQTGQDRLGLGVAEAAVELEHLRPVRRQHQPGEKHADEWRAAPRELLDDRLVNLLDELRDLVRTHPGNREKEPMPPVFGPVSPSPIRLKSCAGASGTTTRPSASAKTDTSSPTSSSSITIGPGKPAAARRPSSSCSTSRRRRRLCPPPARRP